MQHPRTIRPLCFVTAIACLLLAVVSARAQSTLATLTGTVSDASAAVVPGATVLVTSLATGVQRQAVSDAAGSFQIVSLDAGRYVMTVSIQGFQDNVREVEMLARQVVRVDVQLQVAGTSERVEVRGTQPVIETERSTIGHSRSGEDIDKLAMNFRATDNTSPIVVATLAQGVQQDRTGRNFHGGRTAIHDVVLGRRHLVSACPLRRTLARAVSVGRIHRGIQGHHRRQQRRVHAGN